MRIKELLEVGKIKEALLEAKDAWNHSQQNEVLALLSRYNRLQKSYNQGIISTEEKTIEENKISISLLKQIDKIGTEESKEAFFLKKIKSILIGGSKTARTVKKTILIIISIYVFLQALSICLVVLILTSLTMQSAQYAKKNFFALEELVNLIEKTDYVICKEIQEVEKKSPVQIYAKVESLISIANYNEKFDSIKFYQAELRRLEKELYKYAEFLLNHKLRAFSGKFVSYSIKILSRRKRNEVNFQYHKQVLNHVMIEIPKIFEKCDNCIPKWVEFCNENKILILKNKIEELKKISKNIGEINKVLNN